MISSPIWLPATLVAGAVQAWRTAVQRRVSHSLSLNGAGRVRYLYGLPFTLALANHGYRSALAHDTHLRQGLNVHKGQITYKAVAEAHDLPFTAPEEALGIPY